MQQMFIDILQYAFPKKHIYIIILGLGISPFSSLASNTIVDMQTNRGLITVLLADDKAPVTVNNFLTYVDERFYEGTLFHRVVNGQLIQGGGYNADLELKEVNAPIILESNVGLSNRRGTISMARRHAPDTANAQFFINTVDNLHLDYKSLASPGYAVFGEVIEGMDVVDAISEQATESVPGLAGAGLNVPILPVLIEVVRLRSGQLQFEEMQATYTTGDIIAVNLQETIARQVALDLWVAVLTEDGSLLYVTEQGFSLMPIVFKHQVAVTDTHHPVFEFVVPQELAGHFTLFAIFNNPDDGLEDLIHSLRSNIAQASIELVQ